MTIKTVCLSLFLLLASCNIGGYAPSPSLYFVYVEDAGAVPGIYGYSLASGTGALSSINGSPFLMGTTPFNVSVDPSRRFLYATDTGGSSGLYGFRINPVTGALTPLSGSPFLSGTALLSISVEATGRFVYSIGTGGIFAFLINSSSGSLTQIAGSPFAVGTSPARLNIDPKGKFIFATDNGATPGLYAYAVNSSTGSLSLVTGSPFAMSTQPRTVTVDENAKFVYALDRGAIPGIYGFSIGASGALSPISGSPFSCGTLTDQGLVSVESNLYSACTGANGIYSYSINSVTGQLSLLSGSPVSLNPAMFFTMLKGVPFLFAASQGGGTVGIHVYPRNVNSGAISGPGISYPVNTTPQGVTVIQVPQPRFP